MNGLVSTDKVAIYGMAIFSNAVFSLPIISEFGLWIETCKKESKWSIKPPSPSSVQYCKDK